jgi:hypothetical protein
LGLKGEKYDLAAVVDEIAELSKRDVERDGELPPTVFHSVGGHKTAALCHGRRTVKQVLLALNKSAVDWVAIALTAWMSDLSKMTPRDRKDFLNNYVYGDVKKSPDKRKVLLIQAKAEQATYTRIYEVIEDHDQVDFKLIEIPPGEVSAGYLSL